MAAINRYNVEWTIPNAGPSVTTLHFAPAGSTALGEAISAFRTFLQGNAPSHPNSIAWNFPTEYVTIQDETGEMLGVGNIPPLAPVPGTSTSNDWSGSSGYRVDWLTTAVRAGRRVRGSSFFTPSAPSAFDDGSVNTALRTGVTDRAVAFLNAAVDVGSPMVIFSRPTSGLPGTSTPVTGAVVPAMPATLRGRKRP